MPLLMLPYQMEINRKRVQWTLNVEMSRNSSSSRNWSVTLNRINRHYISVVFCQRYMICSPASRETFVWICLFDLVAYYLQSRDEHPVFILTQYLISFPTASQSWSRYGYYYYSQIHRFVVPIT